MNRSDFQKLAEIRIQEAKVLLDNKCYESVIQFRSNWTLVCEWSEEKRYETRIASKKARELFRAIANSRNVGAGMVEEVLVRESLSTQEIACGEELLSRIEQAGIEVLAAYWIRDRTAEIVSWILDIVTPEVDRKGPLKLYERIHELVSVPTRISCGLDINTIEVLGVGYSFFESLKSAVGSVNKAGEQLSNVRLSQLVVGSSYVDLFIYRFPVSRNGPE